MSNLSSGNSSESGEETYETSNVLSSSTRTSSDGSTHHQPKKTRKLPGNPDPSAEVIALSPRSIMAKNRFICEVCNKGFQREQNLQLHRRGHNLPWKLKQKAEGSDINKKRVYICPEASCIHHNPDRALGDLTGIKKHYSRKHGEKKWKCDKCSKKYAVQSDWKAHFKACGTKDYKCDCGTIFSRRDSFVTHRAFCDALAEENNKVKQLCLGSSMSPSMFSTSSSTSPSMFSTSSSMSPSMFSTAPRNSFDVAINVSATSLLQQAAQMGAIVNSPLNNSLFNGMQVPTQSDHIMHGFGGSDQTSRMQNDGWYNGIFSESQNITKEGHNSLTLDFLGNGANEFQ